ncbi:MAG TPA: hypothetical protein VFF59_04155, partial [Anaerolineae bacterium]|nr:hypothetical protein [Anaerolineae bacterium]
IAAGSSAGISSSGWRTVVAINGDDTGGRLIIHELMHAFGFVDSDASNYQQSDVPGEDNHSKYNEGRWSDFNNCSSSRTYKQALIDQAGGNKRVVRLISGNVPADLRTAACNSAAEDDQSNTAKSIISYSPNRDNFNTVMEPMDWRNMITQLCEDGGCVGYAGLTALNAPIGIAAPVAANDVTHTLRIGGRINLSATLGSQVTTTISYVGLNDGEVTPQDFSGDAHLVVRDAGNTVLHDQTFVLEETALGPHDSNAAARSVARGSAPAHAGVAAVSLFHLRVPFPDNAASVEISHDGDVLWSKSISANAPTVNVTAPNGGTFNAANPITVMWTANDTDGDPLQYGLDFSADDGATWLSVAPYITNTSIVWTPNFVTATNTARVRIRASDGFNTAYSTSAQFTLTPRAPEAIILSPENGGIYAEGEVIDLKGTSLTSDGVDAGAFTWQLNNVTVGNTRTVTTPLTAIGVSTITLQVTANALNDARSITVTVTPDYDRDRMLNAWELQYQFNPLDPTDAAGDADNDSLSNIDEYRLGTNPRSSDTDGDGASDSAEINAGTDPLSAASQPIATPILNVGSVSMGFTINNYSSLPGPKSTWVTNLGGGTLNYTATTDAAWLTATPAAGSAPQELTVWANSLGMPIGVYQG